MKRAANCPRYEREREREGETDSGQRTLSSLNTKLTKHVHAGGKWHEAEATSTLGRGKVNTRLKDSLSLSQCTHTLNNDDDSNNNNYKQKDDDDDKLLHGLMK